MLRYLKGDRMFLSSTALLAVVGLLIALLWAWVWSGAFASARRVAMRLDLRGGSSASEMNRVVWPLMPLLSLLWFVTADLVRHEAMGPVRSSWGSWPSWWPSQSSPCIVAACPSGRTRGGWPGATTWRIRVLASVSWVSER